MKKRLVILVCTAVVIAAVLCGAFFAFNSPRFMADIAVGMKLGIWDLSYFDIVLTDGETCEVKYYLRPEGFGTYESIYVTLDSWGMVSSIESDLNGVYRAMEAVSSDQLRAAEQLLWKQLVDFPEADRKQFRLMTRDDGCLYLYTELIVDAKPEENAPCGDHWHKFFEVKVSK